MVDRKGDFGHRRGRIFDGDFAAQSFPVGQQQGELLQPGIMADEEEPFDGIAHLVDDVEQQGRRGEIEARVIFGIERPPITVGDLVERLPHPHGGRGEHAIETQPLRAHLAPHRLRRLASARVERTIEVAGDRIVPGRLGVAQQRQNLHDLPSTAVSPTA